MIVRIITYFLGIFLLSACLSKNRTQITELIKTWDGKEILFPKKMNMFQVGDSIHKTLSLENYKIIVYVDTNGCFTCKLHLMEWEDFITGFRTRPFLFCTKKYGGSKRYFERKSVLLSRLH